MSELVQPEIVATEPQNSGRVRPVPLSRRAGWAAGATAAIVALADFLFFGHEPGISLFIFVVGVGLGIALVWRNHLGRPLVAPLALLALLLALPLVEAPAPVPVLLAGLGLALFALAAAGRLPRALPRLPGTLIRYGVVAPAVPVIDSYRFLAGTGRRGLARRVLGAIAVWLVPLAFALVFAYLFAAANPVIENLLEAINLESVASLLDPGRIVFWVFVAGFAWPLLLPRLLRVSAAPATAPATAVVRPPSLVFGRGAILRSLIVFNALFAVQTGLDLLYLWSGYALPEGMSYADYAHRGAYPLIATALLAAAFVLAAMRRGGPGETSRLIRNLVYLWIGQNVLLVISSMFRLELYVEAYGLSELRIAAGIWMGLVAVGLVLISARIALGQSNSWLVATNLVALVATLYASSYIDYAWTIATYNVEHSYEMTGKGAALDLDYLQTLGPGVIPALDRYLGAETAADPARKPQVEALRAEVLWSYPGPEARNWREWIWRDARLDRYLAGSPVENRRQEPIRISAD